MPDYKKLRDQCIREAAERMSRMKQPKRAKVFLYGRNKRNE